MSSSASCYESSSILESHGILATLTSYVNKSSSILLSRFTSLLKTSSGVWQGLKAHGDLVNQLSLAQLATKGILGHIYAVSSDRIRRIDLSE
ncbi:hypothetical protein Tco_0303174 [Tanacetum coccineum]